MQTRKQFIKQSCSFMLAASALGLGLTSLQSCSVIKTLTIQPTNGVLKVPLSAFVNEKGEQLRSLKIKTSSLPFELFLSRRPDNTQFLAIYLMCSHEEQPLTPTSTGFSCASHGSKFSLEGKVLAEPAIKPLRTFPVKMEGEEILVQL